MKNSNEHYYQDGDIIIIVEDTSFKIYKQLLKLASPIFENLIDDANNHYLKKSSTIVKKSKDNEANEMDKADDEMKKAGDDEMNEVKEAAEETLTLTLQESAVTFSDLLTFINPKSYFEIKWENIEETFRIADFFMVNSLIKALFKFLYYEYQENLLLSIHLAYLYEDEWVFKESSKLILDKFPIYFLDQSFDKLEDNVKASLLSRYFTYTLALENIEDFTKKLIHKRECASYNKQSTHNNFIISDVNNKSPLSSSSPLSPSTLKNMIFQKCKEYTRGCNEDIMNDKVFEAHFGQFEPLKRGGDTNFIFIELDY